MIELIFHDHSYISFFEDCCTKNNLTIRKVDIASFELDLNQPPDNIIYLNLVDPNASSHDLLKTEQYLEYLAAYNMTVINDFKSLNIEMNRVEQYRLIKRFGLTHPETAFGSDKLTVLNSTASLPMPLIVKQNRSKEGVGSHYCENFQALETYVNKLSLEELPDGILLVQHFIQTKNNLITRVELIDYKFVYAYTISTDPKNSTYEYLPDFSHPLISKFIDIAKAANLRLAEFEFVEGKNGALYTYDINALPDYPDEIEKKSDDKAANAFVAMITTIR